MLKYFSPLRNTITIQRLPCPENSRFCFFQEGRQKHSVRKVIGWLGFLTHYANPDGKVEVGNRGSGRTALQRNKSKSHGPRGNVAM